MYTLPHFSFATCVATCLSALRHRLVEGLHHRRSRAMARRAAQAFELLDDRTLRDLGFRRGDGGAIAAEAHGLSPATLNRVIHLI